MGEGADSSAGQAGTSDINGMAHPCRWATCFALLTVKATGALLIYQLLEKSSDLIYPIHEMYFHDPMPAVTIVVRLEYIVMIVGMYIQCPVARTGLFVGPGADDMAGYLTGELPAILFCQISDIAETGSACKGILFIIPNLYLLPCCLYIIIELLFKRVVAEDIGSSEVGFIALDNRPEIQKQDIVLPDNAIRRILVVSEQRVGARPYYIFMPELVYPKRVFCQLDYFFRQCPF